MPHKAGIGAIFGIVSEDGVAKQNFPVNLYDRSNGAHVARQLTDQNGGFVFNGLNLDTNDYQVVAQDEDDPPYKNAIIQDRIQPVPGYQGATFYGNWRILACQKGAEMIYAPIGVQAGDIQITGPSVNQSYSSLRSSGGSDAMPFTPIQTLTPGAPDIPGTDLAGNKLCLRERLGSWWSPSSGKTAINQNPLQCSMEFVADLSTLGPPPSQASGVVDFYATLGYYAITPETYSSTAWTAIVTAEYDPVAKTIIVYRNSYVSTAGSLIGSGFTTALSPSVDMSAYQDGPHHFLITMVYGLRAVLYVDGVQVATWNITGTATPLAFNDVNYGWLTLAGVLSRATNATSVNYPATANGASGHVGIMAIYPGELTAADAIELYQASMVGSTPLVSGYAKEVLADAPVFYARLNDSQDAATISNYLRPNPIYDGIPSGALTKGVPTSVAGGMGVTFSGSSSVRFNSDGLINMSAKYFGIEFVGKPSLANPAAIETIYMASNSSEARSFQQLQRNTSGNLVLINQASGAETITFNTKFDDTENFHHFLITVDKVNYLATVYVDGVQVEQQNTNTNTFDTAINPPNLICEGHLGGVQGDNGGTTTQGFHGTLSEVALYQTLLSAARAAAHAAAMSVP